VFEWRARSASCCWRVDWFTPGRGTVALRGWYERHRGIEASDWGGQQFDWGQGGSTAWSVFAADTGYFGRPGNDRGPEADR
jgi:hypothetical protein